MIMQYNRLDTHKACPNDDRRCKKINDGFQQILAILMLANLP